MTRSTKYFLAAIFSAVGAWVAGTMLVGVADLRYFTASGPVDQLDSYAVSRALADPTYTASLSWGSFTLTGIHWTFTLPLIFAGAVFIAVLLSEKLLNSRSAP